MASEPTTIETVLQAAGEAQRGNRPGEAVAILRRGLASLGAEPGAGGRIGNALGNLLLNLGEAGEARIVLARAAAIEPGAAAIHYNLSLACRALQDTAAEEAALRAALVADPFHLHALLGLGEVLVRGGRRHAAAAEYRHAVTVAEQRGELPPALARRVDLARRVIAQDADERRAFFAGQVEAALGTGALGTGGLAGHSRMAQAVRVFAGVEKVYHSEPTFLHFPGSPSIQFFERGDFPWLDAIEAQTAAIRDEFLAVAQAGCDFVPYVSFPEGRPLNQWEELNNNPDWDSFHLWRNGARFAQACAACPVTTAAIEAAPQPAIRDNAPNLMFSRLRPQTHIPPHHGMTNTRLVVHLPLIVPEGCWFRVGNDTRPWIEGQAWVFDDSILHEAMNPTVQDRVILMWDVWNPLLTPDERALVAVLVEAQNSYEGG